MSKYDPSRRDVAGRYVNGEWTSVCDIGKFIGRQVLTVEEYLRVENAYIETSMAFHLDTGAPPLLAHDVEAAGSIPNLPGQVVLAPPAEDHLVGRSELPVIIRSCLREIVWCRLEAKDGSCVIHFGYEYYMYLVGICLKMSAVEVAQAVGLFMEPFRSPYLLPV
ncbi:hypothetical protein WMF18_32215 [Sorangium sp. So ce315]|uniref:hypothetical protein n=1 Tax=Sorangium sp. So ce315 TaxID=3133299 RepID=UPI003F635B37